MAMVNDDELKKFREYAEGGGRLIIYGDFATQDALGRKRDANQVLTSLGIAAFAKEVNTTNDMTINYNGRCAKISDMQALLNFQGGEKVAELSGSTVGIRVNIGKGEIVWISAKPIKSEFQPTIWSNRRIAKPLPVEAAPWLYEHQKSHTGAILRLIVGDSRVQVACEEEKLLIGAYNTPAGIAINVANVADTVPEAGEVSHQDKIIHYVNGAERLPQMELTVKCDKIKSAYLQSPEFEDRVELLFTCTDGITKVNVPANTFAAYALILLEE